MEPENQEQDSFAEQKLKESSLNLEGVHTTSPLLSSGMPKQELDTAPTQFPEEQLAFLHNSDWQLRVKAVQALRGSRKLVVLQELITLLDDEEAVVRIAAIQTLGALGEQAPVQQLLATLQDSDWTVRETAVLTLGALGNRVPQGPLTQALYDEQKFVREAAAYALRGRLPIEILMYDLKHGDTALRVSAARILGELEEPTAVRPLIDAIQSDQQNTVRKAAILALGQMEISISAKPLKAALQAALHDSDQDVREAAAIVLEANGMLPVPDSDAGLASSDMDTQAVLWTSMQEMETNNDMQVSKEEHRVKPKGSRKMTNYVGQQFGSYILTNVIGEGSRATVYLGKHIYLKTEAAIKVLNVHLPEKDLQGFLNEAQMVAKLKHPAIVRVLDFGVKDDIPFLAMDYAPKGNLRQCYPRGVQAPLSVIVPYVKQIASALQYAHNNGVIHRDVKPENILLSSDNALLLSDFGIAQLERNPSNPYQNRDKVSGTLPYMAPEQWRGEPCAASDQYALAVVVYQWLCGELPFQGSTLNEIMKKHLDEPPPALRKQVPDLSQQVEEVVLTALAKNPKRRYSSVQAFADALVQAVSSMSPTLLDRLIRLLFHFTKGFRRL